MSATGRGNLYAPSAWAGQLFSGGLPPVGRPQNCLPARSPGSGGSALVHLVTKLLPDGQIFRPAFESAATFAALRPHHLDAATFAATFATFAARLLPAATFAALRRRCATFAALRSCDDRRFDAKAQMDIRSMVRQYVFVGGFFRSSLLTADPRIC